jgi:hypothetical protein
MKKILAFAVCATAITGTAMAQGSAEAEVTGKIEYVATIEAMRGIDFGTIYRTDEPQDVAVTEVGETARFYITGDVGDLVDITYPSQITLEGDHIQVVATFADETTPHYYQGDVNSNTMTMDMQAWFRFVTEDEAHRVPWFLPTFLAGWDPETMANYCDIQDDGEHCITEDLDPGQGQINLFVGGVLHVADDQQRGTYSGVIEASVDYN